MTYDLIVIGGGPAGYVGAIRAAQLGKSVLCIEKERVGGTCLNWGCIPTKALLKNAEVFHNIHDRAKEFGIKVDQVSFDWNEVVSRSRAVADRLAHGVSFLFKKNKIESLTGEAYLKAPHIIEVTTPDGEKQLIEAQNVLLCTGAKTTEIPPLPFDNNRIIGSRKALMLEEFPSSVIVVGAGAIGVEFASIFNSFGAKVTIVEMQDRLLPIEDNEVSTALERSLKKQGIQALTKSKTISSEIDESSVKVTVETPKGTEILTADICLVAVGVRPVMIEGDVQPLTNKQGFIEVNERFETSLPNVYAAGDIIGPPLLAHVASHEAVQAVEAMFGEKEPTPMKNFPGCTYCHPQVASIGKTEQALKEANIAYKVGKFSFMAIGKAQASGDTDGFVKLLFGKEQGELLGAHIIGDNASELISEFGLALTVEATEEDFQSTIYAHPTLAEAIHEAALAADNRPIHS